jgi:hypothetical protein
MTCIVVPFEESPLATYVDLILLSIINGYDRRLYFTLLN